MRAICTSASRPPAPGSAVWPLLLAAACAAIWIDLGVIHEHHQSDTLIPVLVSLYYWTPFYWAQDRWGMLVPLLAIPFVHPFVNLLVQAGLSIFGSLAAVVLVARYAVCHPVWPLVAGLAIAGLLVLVPVKEQAIYFLAQPYGVATALCVGGLLLAQSSHGWPRVGGRLGLALVLVGTAHWVNIGVGLPVTVLAVVRALFAPRQSPADPEMRTGAVSRGLRRLLSSDIGLALVLLALGLVIGLALRATGAPRYATALTVTSPGAWPEGWRRLLTSAWISLGPSVGPAALVGSTLAGLALLVAPAARRGLPMVLPAVLSGTAAALAYGGVVGTLGWVAENEFPWRYLLPSLLFLGVAVAAWMVAPLAASGGSRLHASVHISAIALIALGAVRHTGLPSLTEARRAVHERLGERTADVLAAGATHVAGDYWKVWPAVFHANLVLYERTERRVIWGLSWRSRPAEKRWRRMPAEQVRVTVPPDDPEAPWFIELYGFAPAVVVEKHRTVWLVRPARGLRPGEQVLEHYGAPAAR